MTWCFLLLHMPGMCLEKCLLVACPVHVLALPEMLVGFQSELLFGPNLEVVMATASERSLQQGLHSKVVAVSAWMVVCQCSLRQGHH